MLVKLTTGHAEEREELHAGRNREITSKEIRVRKFIMSFAFYVFHLSSKIVGTCIDHWVFFGTCYPGTSVLQRSLGKYFKVMAALHNFLL